MIRRSWSALQIRSTQPVICVPSLTCPCPLVISFNLLYFLQNILTCILFPFFSHFFYSSSSVFKLLSPKSCEVEYCLLASWICSQLTAHSQEESWQWRSYHRRWRNRLRHRFLHREEIQGFGSQKEYHRGWAWYSSQLFNNLNAIIEFMRLDYD